MKRKINTRGETLAETIIALSVLAMGITIASTVMLNSIRNMVNAKNRVIAVNIAREGIEAVRNIRDTNWLFYSDKRRQCWNHDPSALNPCDGTEPILPGTYIVYKHTDQSWRLQLADSNLFMDTPELLGGDSDIIPDNDLDRVDLSLVDVDISANSDGLGGVDDDLDMYNHTDATSPLGTEIKSTIYTRYIVIEYLENQPDGLFPSNITEPNESINTEIEWGSSTTDALNRMRITSIVGWERRGSSFTAELKTIITDHLGREDISS